MKNILAIDTATEVLSVALLCRTGSDPRSPNAKHPIPPRVYGDTRDVGLHHSHLLMPLVNRMLEDAGLKPADLHLIACTRGPGSFTGLRIGMATAKGLATAIATAQGVSDPPVVSVPTLEVMAAGLPAAPSLVVAVIDGRKQRFYSALFMAGERVTSDLDLSAEDLVARINRLRSDQSTDAGGNRDASTANRRDKHKEWCREIVVTGPHADVFLSRVDDRSAFVLDPGFRRGHAPALIALAEFALARRGPDALDQGPDYLRGSDAELSRRQT